MNFSDFLSGLPGVLSCWSCNLCQWSRSSASSTCWFRYCIDSSIIISAKSSSSPSSKYSKKLCWSLSSSPPSPPSLFGLPVDIRNQILVETCQYIKLYKCDRILYNKLHIKMLVSFFTTYFIRHKNRSISYTV